MLLSASPHQMSINQWRTVFCHWVCSPQSVDKQMGTEKSFYVRYRFCCFFTRYIPLKDLLAEYLGNLDAKRITSTLTKKALPHYTNEPKE